MKVLAKYKNGNVRVTLFDDGTKVMSYDETKPVIFEYPTSLDVKITNHCEGIYDHNSNNGRLVPCQFCHENSNKNGKHGDLNKLMDVLSCLPGGQEIALGGGNALSHTDLIPFLEKCKEKHIISNITVNKQHLNKYDILLRRLIDEKLIYGLGISIPGSISSNSWSDSELYYANYQHTVAHLIMGIHEHSIIDILKNIGIRKFLLLGYKIFGRGAEYYKKNKDNIINSINSWKEFLLNYLHNTHISFDNLAVEQLNLKEMIDPKIWNTLYQGDDFSHTMYIDAVNEEYAPSSRSEKSERVKWKDMSLLEYFNNNKNKFN